MVKLEGIYDSISYNDVVAAVGFFGKTKSVILFRSKLQVCTVRVKRVCMSFCCKSVPFHLSTSAITKCVIGIKV